MAKTSGLGATILCDDASSSAQTISNDCTNFQMSTPRGLQDITGVDKSAHERLLLLADYSVTINGVFDNGANLSHAVFKTIPSTSVNRNVKIEPTSGSTPFLSCLCALSDYQITRPASGELTWQVKGDLADGTVPTWNLCRSVATIRIRDSDMPGFEPPSTGQKLDFSGTAYAGLEVTMDAITLGDLLDITELAEEASSAAAARELFKRFAKSLESWNVTRKGEQVPATYEGVLSLDAAFIAAVVQSWQQGMAQAPPPLPGASSSGGISGEGSTLGLADVSKSLPS